MSADLLSLLPFLARLPPSLSSPASAQLDSDISASVELLKDGALGLSVCKKLALLMGGDIQCESEVGKVR